MNIVTDENSAKPVGYDISLYDLELAGAFGFQGTVKIEIEITVASKQIILNAYQLNIHSAEISSTDFNCMPSFRSRSIDLLTVPSFKNFVNIC